MKRNEIIKVDEYFGIMPGLWIPQAEGKRTNEFVSMDVLVEIGTSTGSYTGYISKIMEIPDKRDGRENFEIYAIELSTEYGELEIPFCDIETFEVL